MSVLTINQLVSNFNFKNYTVALFLPIIKHNELNTSLLIQYFNENNIKWCIPKTDLKTWEMNFYSLNNLNDIVVNKIGVPEPENGTLIKSNEIDLFIVPLLAHDLKGHRVGYGKGCYDRYFNNCNNKNIKIGITVFDQPIDISDSEKTDVKLDFCVTPFSKYEF